MNIRIFASAAVAALIPFASPAFAAASPELFSPAVTPAAASSPQAVDAFYAARHGAPLWTANNAAASSLLQILRRAPLDGLASGPDLAAHAEALLARANAGDQGARAEAERLLSSAWVLYVQGLQAAPTGMTYADHWVAPRPLTPGQILASAATAPSLSAHIAKVSSVNPIYAQLRDAAWNQLQASGTMPSASVIASLDRARDMPVQDRYVMVDAASATLWMIDDGKVADSMKVIVGKPTAQTPMVASTIYYATLNPYWNVPEDLLRKLIGPRIVAQGVKYITDHNYDVLSGYGDDAQPLDPKSVDWKAVVDGTVKVHLRQRPGPANSMGDMKFGFANANDIYLHDSPEKDLFAADNRNLSNGCIRLSDAPRLARFLLGRDAKSADAGTPEQHILLPTPVPIYVTYLTAQVRDGQLAQIADVYGRDATAHTEVASLR